MKIYSITDNISADGPEGFWIAVWARTKAEAMEFAKHEYSKNKMEKISDILDFVEVITNNDYLIKYKPSIIEPCQETRPEVLRLLGWRYDDEAWCVCCDLAPMGMEKYEICDDCDQCRECASEEMAIYQCHCVS